MMSWPSAGRFCGISTPKPLTISQMDESFLVIEPLRMTDRIEPEDVDTVIRFNKINFEVSESSADEAEKKINWSAKRFLVIGST